MMTLAQFALAAQADPKWVQNAVQSIGLFFNHSEDQARQLGLARVLNSTLGMPLRAAWDAAGEALRSPNERELVITESADGSVRGVIDVYRYLSSFTAALSRAMAHEPRAPGRPVVRERSAVYDAREYGIDISLLEAALDQSVEERLREADANAEFVRAIRGQAGR